MGCPRSQRGKSWKKRQTASTGEDVEKLDTAREDLKWHTHVETAWQLLQGQDTVPTGLSKSVAGITHQRTSNTCPQERVHQSSQQQFSQ